MRLLCDRARGGVGARDRVGHDSAADDVLSRNLCGGQPGTSDRRERAVGAGGTVALFAHDVQRPVLDLVVDTAHVLADHAQRDQLDAAEQQDRDGQGSEARKVGAREVQPITTGIATNASPAESSPT